MSTKCLKSPHIFHNYFRSYSKKLCKPVLTLTTLSIFYCTNNIISHNHPDIVNNSLITIPITNDSIHNSNINTIETSYNSHTNIITSIQSIAEYITKFFKSIYRISILWLYFLPPIVLSPVLLIQIPMYSQYWWDVLRCSICNAGPCFIKFSQWAATRPDLFKESICIELSKLQSLTYIHNWRHTKKILVDSFGLDWYKHLTIHKDNIIGSGCVAQVYKGILHGDIIIDDAMTSKTNMISNAHCNTNSNTRSININSSKRYDIPVAIKILHPGIREALQTDLLLLRNITTIIEIISGNILFLYDSIYHNSSNHKTSTSYLKSTAGNPLVCISLNDSMNEFAIFMEQQLDLYQEGKALYQFQQNFLKNKLLKDKVIIPNPWYIYGKKHLNHIDNHDCIDSTDMIILSNICIEDTLMNKNRINTMILDDYQCISKHKDILIESFEEGVSMIDILHNQHHNKYSYKNNYINHYSSSSDNNNNKLISQYNNYLAELGLDIILKMIFEDNFIHADLHAGNILVRFPTYTNSNDNTTSNTTNSNSNDNTTSNYNKQVDNSYPKIILLDAGLTVQLQPYDRKNFIALFKAVLDNDGREVARLIMKYTPTSTTNTNITNTNRSKDSISNNDSLSIIHYNTIIDPEEYKNKMQELVNKVHKEGLLLSKISVSMLLKQLLKISYDHNVKLESRFVSVILSIILAEGMGKKLDPENNIILKATPYIRNAALNQLFNKK